MKYNEVKHLYNGVYRIWWKSGGQSVASLGRFANGDVWIAPSNWIDEKKYNLRTGDSEIRKMTLLALSKH